jgi:hypothetical protein
MGKNSSRNISELGDARSQMVEGQPSPKFDQVDATVSVAANTTWYIEASPPRGALLAFYHPKFGPVGITLQRGTAGVGASPSAPVAPNTIPALSRAFSGQDVAHALPFWPDGTKFSPVDLLTLVWLTKSDSP